MKVIALAIALLVTACNIQPQKGKIAGINVEPLPVCIGQTVNLTGIYFSARKVTVWAVPGSDQTRVRLGEAEVDEKGKWSLSFQLEARMVQTLQEADQEFIRLTLSAEGEQVRVGTSIPICPE